MSTTRLKRALLSNAAFSSISGFSMLVFSAPLSQLIGLSQPVPLRLIGAGLLLFAGSIIWTATRPSIPAKAVRAIIWQDWAWVAASAVVILLQAFDLSNIGYFLIAGVAAIVALFAVLQHRYLLRSRLSATA